MKKLMIVLSLCLCLCGCTQESKPEPKEDTSIQQSEEQVTLTANDKYEEPLNPYNEMSKAYNALSAAVESGDAQAEAQEVARSFVFDFFTLSNKKNSEDIGGLQFIPSVNIRQYMEYAKSYYYSNYSIIVNEYGKDALPKVVDVKVESIEPASFTYFEAPCEGYDVVCSVTYAQSDLPAVQLKTSMVVSVMNINDFDFSREYDYRDAATIFEGEMKDCWRVLAVQ